MKLVTFKVHTEERLGAIVGGRIVDLNSAYALYLKEAEGRSPPPRWMSMAVPSDMRELLEGGDESLRAARKALDFAASRGEGAVGPDGEKIFLTEGEARLMAPVPRPGSVYCLAVNYYDHGTERIKEPREREAEVQRWKGLNLNIPVAFQKPSSVVCGPGDPIIKPRNSDRVDYECELAAVIGKAGKYIPAEEAYGHIAGYTILIDVSFRDHQRFPEEVPWDSYRRNTNWVKGKGMDNAAPMGPCLVTRDEIPDPYTPPLRLVTRVNGQVRQNGDVSTMIIRIPRLIEYLSAGTTLHAGDVIATGTVAGVAASWDGYLKPGDVVECEIQPIGVLRHRVVEG